MAMMWVFSDFTVQFPSEYISYSITQRLRVSTSKKENSPDARSKKPFIYVRAIFLTTLFATKNTVSDTTGRNKTSKHEACVLCALEKVRLQLEEKSEKKIALVETSLYSDTLILFQLGSRNYFSITGEIRFFED